ncbi:carcinoembryonic antigen-related cell adhesion molecule 3-like isoform X1 [Pelobates cultripes]|uniref:Carcinoembryonic antigen-related cell adhesion molecule 3-like isoform X1 n=1 Tax=Pelobates cultripes TaxID=61616 RepID=A0AAD1T1H6_PELCU|nr:carcinoembryonic antigen-related cell adhesion molecule 3-like isoform X1 [Pelobates cultripes]
MGLTQFIITFLVLCSSVHSKDEPDLQCTVNQHKQVTCLWDQQGVPKENYTLKYWFDNKEDSAVLCPKYLLNESIHIGCWIQEPIETFTPFTALLISSNLEKTVQRKYNQPQNFASTSGNDLILHRNPVNVTVGVSVHLLTSYTLPRKLTRFVIEWSFLNRNILDYHAFNCSVDVKGIPTWCNGKTKIYPRHKGRVEFNPLNASLLLKNAQLNDTGIYMIDIAQHKKIIQVWVHKNTTCLASTSGNDLIVHTNSVNVTVGESVHLLTSYTLPQKLSKFVIEWSFLNRNIIDNCSVDLQGIPTWCNEKTKIYARHKGRVEFNPLNVSLLIKNVQLSDTRIYIIDIAQPKKILPRSFTECLP